MRGTDSPMPRKATVAPDRDAKMPSESPQTDRPGVRAKSELSINLNRYGGLLHVHSVRPRRAEWRWPRLAVAPSQLRQRHADANDA
jgi:hypothetical protein